MITVSDYTGAMAVLKHPDMIQALYDDGHAVMGDVLLTLHGEAHTRRRLVEFSVFKRGFFRHYEREVFPAALDPVLAPYLDEGRADLVELGYRVMMNLTADFAGIDRPANDVEETEALLALIRIFSTGATLAHSTLDHDVVNREVSQAMQILDERFLQPSIARRQHMLQHGQPLPNDILSTLLTRGEKLELSDEVLRREIAFFLQAGAHSSANSTVHAIHEIFDWIGDDGRRRAELMADPVLLQRCVHESLRLHPASPVAQRRAAQDIHLLDQDVAAGTLISVDLRTANRDPAVFGADADSFDPHRKLDRGVWPFGLTFGYGVHACLGRDLDGGVTPKPDADPEMLQLGIVPLMVRALLARGASRIPDEPPQADPNTTRDHFGCYPVAFQQDLAA